MKNLLLLSILLIVGCVTEPEDCAGVAGGTAELDNCNVCDSDKTNDCVPDCAGEWGGESVVDECGVCGGDGIVGCTTEPEDCAGVAGGTAELDNCNVCDTDKTNDCVPDCEGTWGGDTIDDCTGICGGDTIDDCTGICGGDAVVDECGVCQGPGAIYDCGDCISCSFSSCESVLPANVDEGWFKIYFNFDDEFYPTLQFWEEFTGNLGQWGEDWVVYDCFWVYDGLFVEGWLPPSNGTLGTYIYLALSDGQVINFQNNNNIELIIGPAPESSKLSDEGINVVCGCFEWIGIDECGVCGGDGSSCSSPVCDIDGNCYETIQIGEQLWMAENLKVTHYNDGSEITYIANNEDWCGDIEGKYGIINNDLANAYVYSNLYNGYAAVDDRGICPVGWHVPDSLEWATLVNHLGGDSVAGGKMKEVGTEHWNTNIGATNESGFTGLPAGYRRCSDGAYSHMGSAGYFWSSSEGYWGGKKYLSLLGNSSGATLGTYGKHFGFSIRCLGD